MNLQYLSIPTYTHPLNSIQKKNSIQIDPVVKKMILRLSGH